MARRDVTTLLADARSAFAEHYGEQPQVAGIAPGRVNLIGEHTDYTDGLCMPFAIDRHVVVFAAIGSVGDDTLHLASTQNDKRASFDLLQDPLPIPQGWTKYVAGVAQGLRAAGIDVKPARLLVHSDLPVGAGLSSSAALEVASALAILRLSGQHMSDTELVHLAQQAEHRYAGVPCGVMDQFSVVHGRQGNMLVLDTRRESAVPATFPDDELALTLIDSGIRHELDDGSYARRRLECEAAEAELGKSLRDASTAEVARIADTAIRRRARHVIGENQRVVDMAAALADRDHRQIGSLMFASHASMRDDFEASCPETDLLVALASDKVTQGVVGARMTGGGFGGSVIVVTARDAANDLVEAITRKYAEATGINARILAVSPSDGAHAIALTQL
ncbi:MAG: galactokinase [Pseudomonadota bacterium]